MNNYKKIDLWYWNSLREFSNVNLKSFNNSQLPILVLQKRLKDEFFIDILKNIWIENLDSISSNWKTNFDNSFWRSWFNILETKEYWDIWIILWKWAESTQQFSYVSDYYMWWTDIWDKVQTIWSEYDEIWRISWEEVWWVKTEMLLILSKQTMEDTRTFKKNELSALATKFTPILTNDLLNSMPKDYLKPVVIESDSNSELVTQVLDLRFNCVWAIEIVQTWNSLVATETYPVRDWKVYEPSKRDIITGEFEWDIITEIEPETQLWYIANNIQRDIDVGLYKIGGLENKDKKSSELIDEISKQFNK